MKKTLLIFSILFVSFNLFADKLSTTQQKELVAALNYLQYSTAKIKISENKAIAEDIYYSIINEIKIEGLSDRWLNLEYGNFLDACAALKLTQNEKNFIEQINKKEQANAYLNAFSNMGAIFVPGQNPTQLVASLVYTSIANAIAVANTKNQLKTQLEKDMFYLDQKIIENIYNIQTSLFTTSAKLLSNDATGRINENSMSIFMNAIMLKTAKERKYALSEPQLQKNMTLFPPYWYELGKAHKELGEISMAIEAYNKFIGLKQTDIVAKDKYYVNIMKDKIQFLLGSTPEKILTNALNNKSTILNHLEIIKSNYLDSEAGEKNAYLAKIYYLIGEYEESLKCLNYIIESKIHKNYIEEAVALKILIESTKSNNNAILYQNISNFSKIKFGNSDIDFSKIATDKSLIYKILSSEWNPGKNITEYIHHKLFSNADSLSHYEINNSLCLEIPNNIIDNYEISFEINDKLYSPSIINDNTTNSSICFIKYLFDDIESDGLQITMVCQSKINKKISKINYFIKPIKTKYFKAAEKAYKRLGSDIIVHNAQTAIEFGKLAYDYDYEVEDVEELRKKIRNKKQKEGKEKHLTEEQINSEITKDLSTKLTMDINSLQKIKTSVEIEEYNKKDKLYNSSIIKYNEDYYLVGIMSIYEPNTNKKYIIDTKGNIKIYTENKPITFVKEIKELETAAYSGNIKAMVSLGIAYIEGYNREKDPKTGIRWLLTAVNQDNNKTKNNTMEIAQAYKYLGECYWNGIGVNEDKYHAKKYFTKSKEYGYNIDEKYLQ